MHVYDKAVEAVNMKFKKDKVAVQISLDHIYKTGASDRIRLAISQMAEQFIFAQIYLFISFMVQSISFNDSFELVISYLKHTVKRKIL